MVHTIKSRCIYMLWWRIVTTLLHPLKKTTNPFSKMFWYDIRMGIMVVKTRFISTSMLEWLKEVDVGENLENDHFQPSFYLSNTFVSVIFFTIPYWNPFEKPVAYRKRRLPTCFCHRCWFSSNLESISRFVVLLGSKECQRYAIWIIFPFWCQKWYVSQIAAHSQDPFAPWVRDVFFSMGSAQVIVHWQNKTRPEFSLHTGAPVKTNTPLWTCHENDVKMLAKKTTRKCWLHAKNISQIRT